MVKRGLKFSILTLLIVLASFFCVCVGTNINYEKTAHVYADEINFRANVDGDNSEGFVKGTVTGYGEYPVGSEVTLVATPSAGCYFVEWQDELGFTLSTSSSYTFIISKDTSAKAVFDFVKYQVTDNFTYFDFEGVSYIYDSERFNDASLSLYPRFPDTEDFGVEDIDLYYNDIVSLKYKVKNTNSIVKELTSSSFSLSKAIAVIAIDKEGNILWTETNGIKNEDLKGTNVSLYEYDYDFYDYVLATNVQVGDKYITTAVEIKCRITGNLNISVSESNLKLITLSAKLMDKTGNSTDMNISEITDAISFDSGYYGKLTEITVFEGLEEKNEYYLAEPNANYQLTLSDNEDYVYKQTNTVTDRVVKGYFDAFTSGFTFFYERRSYEISFEQIVKNGAKYESVDRSWININTVSLYRGETIKLDFTDKKIYVDDVETSTFTISDTVFGFEFFGFSFEKSLETANTSLEFTVDETNPAETVIYFVLTKIEYNINFVVANINGEYSEYLTSRVLGLPENKVYTRLDLINLTEEVPYGYTSKGWIMKVGTETTVLTQTQFNFIPSSNDVLDIYFLLIIEHDYFDFTFALDAFDENGNNIAEIELSVVEYFTINETADVLTINGKRYNHSGSESWAYQLTKSTNTSTNITFTSDIGSAVVKLTDDLTSYKSVVFNSLTYTYSENDNQFRRYSIDSREEISASCLYGEDYSITLSNVCIDDLIFASSSLLQDYRGDYKFLHFIKSGVNTALPEKTAAEFNGYTNVVIYGTSYIADTEVYVRYVKRDGYINVTSSNQSAYAVNEIEFSDFLGSSYLDGDTVKRVEITSDESVSILIEKSLIKEGYRFVGFFIDFVDITDETHLAGNSNAIVVNDPQYYKFNFDFSSNYRDSTIIVNFEEIVYNITIDTTAEVSLIDKDGNNLLENNEFKLSWSVINDKLPKIVVNSRKGYYISNVYYGTQDEANKLSSLIGIQTEQTSSDYTFTESDLQLVLKLVDADYNLTLYIEEDERLFSITIQYLLPEGSSVNTEFTQLAVVTCTYTEEEEIVLTKTAVRTIGQSNFVYLITFENIKFNTLVNLSMDDTALEGVYFASWQNDADVITSTVYEFTLEDDITLYANFLAIDYTVSFEYLNKDGDTSDDVTSGATLKIDGLISAYYQVGTDIQIVIEEKTGFKLTKAYYIFDETETSIYEQLTSDENFYYYTTNFMPSEYLNTTRNEQLNSNDAKNLVIYLVFEEKLYSIFTTVINNTYRNTNTIKNKTVDEWVEKETLKVLYFNDATGLYEEMPISEDNLAYYRTNTKIQLRFNSFTLGLSLQSVYLGSEDYTISSIGISNIANQEVSLFIDEEKGKNYYILEFVLNSNVLGTCGNTSVFEISFVYKIKTYTMTLTTNTINKNLLASKYGLSLSYVPADTKLSGSVKSKTGSALKIKSGFYYASEDSWTIEYTGNQSGYSTDFDKKYTFRNFLYICGDKQITFSPLKTSGNSYSFSMHETYIDQNGNEFVLWELIAGEDTPTIYAFYEPKITFGNAFDFDNGKYVKKVSYNGTIQKLTSSFDGVENPDIIYASDELGAIEIGYTVDNGMSVEPKNANTYYVSLKIANITYSGEVVLVISRVKLEVNHVGTLSKEYDGTELLTDANLSNLKNQLTLNGLVAGDVGQLDLSGISGYYSQSDVGSSLMVTIHQIRLSSNLLTNYYLVEGVDQVISKELTGVGSIVQKKLTIDSYLFTFYDIVYKPNQEYVLKYKQNSDIIFRETLVESDKCYIDIEKLEFLLNDYSIGYSKDITVYLSKALSGEDCSNYKIDDIHYSIDIYPYEISYELANYGTWTITDYDEGCFIPIETDLNSLYVEVINSNGEGYPELYSMVEVEMSRSEKVHAFYKFSAKTKVGNGLSVKDFAGAYITFDNVKNLTSIFEVGEEVKEIDINKVDNRIIVKIGEDTSNTIGLFVSKSYFAIWRIVLIVSLLLLLLLIIIICIIIYKKIRAKKNDEKNKFY